MFLSHFCGECTYQVIFRGYLYTAARRYYSLHGFITR